MRIGLGIFASAANVASSLSSNFVAVASGSEIYSYSEDAGVTWTSSTLPSSINWKSIINGQNKFVAIADSSNIVAYSTDAITWASSTLPVSQAWADIAYGNDKFVAMAISSTNAAISTDGITWAAMSIPTSATSINSFNDIITVTRSGSSTNIYYSTNGTSWIYTSTMAATGSLYVFGRTSGKTAGGQDITVATGYQGGSSLIGLAYSYNGTTWVGGSMPYTTTSNITYNAVAFGSNSSTKDSRFVAVAYGGSSYSNPSASESSAYSVDGVTWNVATLPSSQIWTGIAFSGNNFVAVAKNSNIGAISTDGITWTSRTLSENQSWEDVAATKQNYTFKTAVPIPAEPVTAVILGDSSTSTFTTDGTTWSSGTSIIGGTWTDGLYDSSKFIAVGPNSSNVIYSTDGVSWQISNDVDNRLISTYSDKYIAFNGSDKYLIASSQQSKGALSTDGITWTYASTPVGTYSVGYGHDRFVIVNKDNNSSQVRYSTNGSSWSSVTPVSGLYYHIHGFAFDSSANIMVGVGKRASNYGSLLLSTDGTTWTTGTMPALGDITNITYNSVAFGNGNFVAVGTSGTSAYSTDGTTWTSVTMPSYGSWTGITYTDNKFIAISTDTSDAATSTDGSTWTIRSLPTSSNWNFIIGK